MRTRRRSELVRLTREHLERVAYPRIELSLIITLSGIAAFLVSFSLLRAGVDSMALRYGASAAAGYVAFLVVIAVWIAWKRQAFRPDLDIGAGDLLDGVDVGSQAHGEGVPAIFAGGRSGGGGASGSWDGGTHTSGSHGGSSWGDALDESLGLVILIILAVIGGLLAIGYVVYLAPLLLAEVLVDAVIIATISRRIAATDRRDWTATVLRRTWIPALTLIAMLVAGGWALQKLAPDARSIGPAINALRQ